MTGELPSSIVAEISFIGRAGGAVKGLCGFRKGHHRVPDVTNATTNGFLGKLCANELQAEAEALFRDVRVGMSYLRKEISLHVAAPVALLTARDFAVEIVYALEERAPARYETVTTLRGLRDAQVARQEKFGHIFARRFSEISFALRRGVQVEAVIDAIEALGGRDGLAVEYPSDCRECVIAVEGVDARVRCTGAALEMVFATAGAPAGLMAALAAVRGAFAISKPLAGLIG
jgi:hypothetical protein